MYFRLQNILHTYKFRNTFYFILLNKEDTGDFHCLHILWRFPLLAFSLKDPLLAYSLKVSIACIFSEGIHCWHTLWRFPLLAYSLKVSSACIFSEGFHCLYILCRFPLLVYSLKASTAYVFSEGSFRWTFIRKERWTHWIGEIKKVFSSTFTLLLDVISYLCTSVNNNYCSNFSSA